MMGGEFDPMLRCDASDNIAQTFGTKALAAPHRIASSERGDKDDRSRYTPKRVRKVLTESVARTRRVITLF